LTDGAQKFVHEALLYSDLEEFVAGSAEFLREGLTQGEAAMAAVPEPRLSALRDALGEDAERVTLVDMGRLGRNPSRILPAIAEFIGKHGGRRVRFIGEPSWPGRRACEAVEAARHEALINLAFAGTASSILCPYDTSLLDNDCLVDAERTHPVMVCRDERRPSTDYTNPLTVWAAADRPLCPARTASTLADFVVHGDVGVARRIIRAHARAAGLQDERLGVLLVAATEAMTNGLLHADPPVRLTLWTDEHDVVCDVTDAGRLTDPMAGRVRPGLEAMSGRGLWIINQLCDLTEIRSGAGGTTVRMRMQRAAAA
jgi:anti-sigma regulatory factor (Ser/Thr protein kinase)